MIGRKCHLLARAEDFPVGLAVTAASVRDRAGSKEILMETGPDLPPLELLWANAGYNGAPFAEWAEERGGWTVEIVHEPEDGSFEILPRRWVVERTFAWLYKCRRLRSDFEYLIESVIGFIHAAMLRLVVRRLALLNEHS